MNQKKGSKRSHNLGENINVTPVMNLFVVLIPFLLFSAVFVKLAVINISLPGQYGDESAVQKSKNAPNIQVTVGISIRRLIVAVSGARNYSREIELDGTKKPIQDLHELLLGVKKLYPSKSDIIVIPDTNVKYEMIVNVIDAARDLLPKDPEIIGRDDSGSMVKFRKLFPDIVLGAP